MIIAHSALCEVLAFFAVKQRPRREGIINRKVRKGSCQVRKE